jgi:hypothetical protein
VSASNQPQRTALAYRNSYYYSVKHHFRFLRAFKQNTSHKSIANPRRRHGQVDKIDRGRYA